MRILWCCALELIRSFIAVDVEKPEIADKIVRIQRDLESVGADLKLVEPENFHFTLQFLGNITPAMVDLVYKAMTEVKAKPFTMTLKGLGAFPVVGNPRVVWIGVSRGGEYLIDIYKQLEPKLRKLGFQPDKEFTPHLTIARVKSGRAKGALAHKIMELSNIEIGEIEVNCIRLKKSTLTPRGPIYETLREVTFK